MTDLLLAKPQLDADWIDLSVGEATIIRNNLFSYFPSLHDPTILAVGHDIYPHDFEYLPPAGLKELVQLLEDKHQAPVIIGNGAKQLLGAVFYAIRKQNIHDLYLQPIHWGLLPPMAKAHGLDVRYSEATKHHRFDSDEFRSAYLLVAPGNPDGVCPSINELTELTLRFQEKKMPFIFDGAYFTHSYLPADYTLGAVGDVQIYSFSKMLGLSSIRGGYAVCHNKNLYPQMVAYQEMMTVGASMLTQKYLYAILKKFQQSPNAHHKFEEANFQDLKAHKKLLKWVPSSILEVPENIDETYGMFAWVKIKDAKAFERAKIYIVNGKLFGDETKVRLNLGVDNDVLKECVKRLQEAA